MYITPPPMPPEDSFRTWTRESFQMTSNEINTLKGIVDNLRNELNNTKSVVFRLTGDIHAARDEYMKLVKFVEEQHPEVAKEYRTVHMVNEKFDAVADRAQPEAYATAQAAP